MARGASRSGPPDPAAIPVVETLERVALTRYPGYRRALGDDADPSAPDQQPRRRRVTEADRQAWQSWQQGRIEDAFAEGQRAQAEGRRADALSAFERAHRLSPDDPVLMFALGLARSHEGDLVGCLALMERAGAAFDMREAWVTATSCALALRLPAQAARLAERLLSTHGFDPALAGVLDQAAAMTGRVGWCALTGAGAGPSLSIACAGPVELVADGVSVTLGAPRRRSGWRAYALPAEWEGWSELAVRNARGVSLLGSPLRPARIARLQGFVERAGARDVAGWAWYPADPDRTPRIAVRLARADGAGDEVAALPLDESADPLPGNALARPRRIAFTVPRRLRGVALDFVDAAGQSLLGAPLDPALQNDRAAFAPHPAGRIAGRPRIRAGQRPVDVVIPVYRHCRRSLDCIEGALATVPKGTRIVVVEDATPETALRDALAALAARRRIVLVRIPRNRGFTHAANQGLALGGPSRAAPLGRDVVLLNSDTLVGPGWLDRLRRAAYSADTIGSVTPLSNDATILSYPDRRRANPVPDQMATDRLAGLAAQANGDALVDIPTAIGFCMFIRRDCLDQVGLLREDLFAQGYGEENDWSLRALRLGWRHVAATGVYVAHVGGMSFGSARSFLMARNEAILERLHPGYGALVAAHVDADPLAPARRRLDRLRLLAALAAHADRRGAVALVSHDQGGGVERVVRERIAALRAEGRHALVLRPSSEGGVCVVSDEAADAYPNLAYRLPEEFGALCGLLREAGVTGFEWHHMLGHEPAVRDLPAALGVPYTITVHDYAAFCPRVTLVSHGRRYCGEPDAPVCEACVASLGARIDEVIGVADLRRRSAAEFAAASRVVVPSADVGRRIERHFPACTPVVAPWEDDRAELDPAAYARAAGGAQARAPRAAWKRDGRRRVVLIGGIGPEKGYDVLLDCLRCVQAQQLPLEFVIAGFTPDDALLREAGCGPITGEYKEGELPDLLAGFDADVAFLPSVCPETWSFTLSEAWRVGLPAVVFDIGTPAERVRRTGRGVVLPIALPPAMICQHLLACAARAAAQRRRLAKTTDASQLSRV